MFILLNLRPLNIGGPRRLPSLPNVRTGLGNGTLVKMTNLQVLIWNVTKYK